MKLWAKILSLWMTILLSLTVIYLPVMAAEETNDGALKAMSLFRMLDVIPEYYDYNINFNQEMTRGDFANAVFKLIAPSGYKGTQVYYYDVTEPHWAYDAICYLTEQGILHGSKDKIFEPDAPIEKAAAYKIMISVLGYQEYASYNGGYPTGYLKTANRLELNEGISEHASLTMAEMLILLFNGATTGVFEPDTFGDSYNVYSISKDKTLLSVHRNLYFQRGIVNGADMMSLNQMELSTDDEVLIDDNRYTTQIPFAEYLGEEIEFLYQYQKTTNRKTIVWAYRTGNTDVVNVETEYDAFFDSDNYVFEYWDGNNEKSIRLDKSIKLIFNGGSTTRGVSTLLNLPRIKVKFAGKGNLYSVAIIEEAETFVIGMMQSEEQIIYDKIIPTKKLELDPLEYQFFSMRLSNEEEIAFEDLKIGNVLRVLKSDDGEHLNVHVGNVTVEGSVSKIISKEHSDIFVISDVEYRKPHNGQTEPYSVGDTVTLYLDSMGMVAYVEVKMPNDYAAFLIRATESDGNFNKTLLIHLLGQDGLVVTKECKERVLIDGIAYKDSQLAYRALCGTARNFQPQFALIHYNAEGKIASIDTIAKTEKEKSDSLSVSVPYLEDQRYKTMGMIGKLSLVDDNTLFFAVPEDEEIATAKDNQFQIVKKSDLVNDSMYSLETYKNSEKVDTEKYVVLKGYSFRGLLPMDMPIIVSNVGTALNEAGESVDCLEGYQGTTLVSICAEDGYDLDGLKFTEGDWVRVRTNSAGEIVYAQILLDAESIATTTTNSADSNAGYRMIVGYVHDVVGKAIRIAEGDPAVCTQVMYGNSIPVLIVDKNERDVIRLGTMNDAETWYHAGGGCSRVALLTRYTIPYLMVIYK